MPKLGSLKKEEREDVGGTAPRSEWDLPTPTLSPLFSVLLSSLPQCLYKYSLLTERAETQAGGINPWVGLTQLPLPGLLLLLPLHPRTPSTSS